MSTLGWQNILVTEGGSACRILIRPLPLIGAIVKIQRPAPPAPLAKVEEEVKKFHPLFAKLETLDDSQLAEMGRLGYRRDNWPLIASKTIIIDLQSSLEEITAKFSKDTRQSLRKAQEHQIRVAAKNFPEPPQESDKDLKNFYDLFQQVSVRNKFWIPSYKELWNKAKAFGERAWVFLAYVQEEKIPCAGAFVLCSDENAYYFHAATSPAANTNFAAYANLYQVIEVMKNAGYKKLDLEGIYDERFHETTVKWKNFTVFKRKWGGEEVTYPGSFTNTYNPFLRQVFNTFARRYPTESTPS
ncbi:MAG: peptidoglycan bridge formation glycyltransferase FemA/FemB family protein [bacterium]|nr:peptidoglycan bridge formation glycyltransferase FemA/FemB family protein [bacterium]